MSPSALSLGRYRLQDLIAAGGMGEVWRAVDTVLERAVAVKLLCAESARQAEAVARFRREARQAGSVSHPAIASVYDFAEAGPSHPPYLVMELVDGPSLAAVLSAGPLDPARTMDVIAQAAEGLHAAHLAGLVHRDVKPANLLLDRQGRVKVTDFGIAHTVGSAPAPGTDMIVGTPAYLAPERAAGAPAAPAGDVYSLGIVAFECLTGRPPFTGTALAVLRAHRDLPLPSLPGTVPAEVAALVAELTAKDPASRPATAGEAADRAARLRDAIPRGATGAPAPRAGVVDPTLTEIPGPDTPAGGPGGPRERGRLAGLPLALAAAAVVVAAVAGLLAGGLLTAARRPSPPVQAAARTVGIRSFIGEPVTAARRQLRGLGLVVRVHWQRTSQQPAGTVVSVWPGGQVRVGSVVTVTGALPPRPLGGEDHSQGGGNDNAGADGNGDGG
jgi:eukaryotic-like serine/threonine-protein kinase